ncbi:AMP-binding protein [Nonomuraea rubra]
MSADWIPVTLPDRLRALAPDAEVVSLGGATEASIWSICHPIGAVDPSWPSIPYGRALGGQSFHILDQHGRPCPVGEPGELHIGGDGLARGYVGDPGQTAERFITHPILRRRLYRTGDLGRWRYDGTIEFLGRLDRQVKIRGHRIELGEIEATLDRHPAVRQAVARAVPGPDDRPRLVCHVVPADPAMPPSDDELAEALRASLPGFMVPNRFLITDALPITDNGKVDYKALANPYRSSGSPDKDETVVPGDGTQTQASPGAAPPAQEPPVSVAHAQASLATVPPAQAISATLARGLRLTLTVSPDGVMELVVEGGADGPPPTRDLATTPQPATPQPTSPQAATPSVGPQPASHREPPPAAPATSQAGPDPQVERAVARVFSELLKTPVDVSTPFFRLGASSLTMVLAHRALRAELDEGLTVVDMFARPTVRELATYITARRQASGNATPPLREGPPPAPDPASAPPAQPTQSASAQPARPTQQAADRQASDQPASDQPASDQPASDQPASDQPASDQAAARRAARARAAELAG